MLPGCSGGPWRSRVCWGVTPPVWGQEKGGLLEVPTFRLVDVPGQQAPAIGEQKGLEVLSGGGCGSVPAVALCCTAQAEQAGDGRVVVGHIAGAGVVAEAGMETRLAVGHRVARGIEVHEVGASPGACLHRGGDDAQPRGRRVLGMVTLSPGNCGAVTYGDLGHRECHRCLGTLCPAGTPRRRHRRAGCPTSNSCGGSHSPPGVGPPPPGPQKKEFQRDRRKFETAVSWHMPEQAWIAAVSPEHPFQRRQRAEP